MSRRKKKICTDYYRLDKINKFDTAYKMIVGERSNGKTYAVKERIIRYIAEHLTTNRKFIYMRRKHKHVVRTKMYEVFDDVENICTSLLGSVVLYSNERGFYIEEENGCIQTIGYAISVEDSFDLKGIPYEDVDIIFFDEFVDYFYMDKETDLFLHLISTIVRDRKDVEVYLVGNTIARACPYFDLFKIDVKKLKQGSIGIIRFKLGSSIAIEYCGSRHSKKEGKTSHKYLGIDDNETINMMLYGDFEYENCNTHGIDGITWNSAKRLVPAYITYLGECYEMSIYESYNPIAFVRKVNVQQGMVKRRIKYNLSKDNSVILNSINGAVPKYNRISRKFMDNEIIGMLDIVKECLNCGRIVYDTNQTGTEFNVYFKDIS